MNVSTKDHYYNSHILKTSHRNSDSSGSDDSPYPLADRQRVSDGQLKEKLLHQSSDKPNQSSSLSSQ